MTDSELFYFIFGAIAGFALCCLIDVVAYFFSDH